MVRPVENEKDLQNLQTLDDNEIRKEFLEQAQTLRNKVFKKVKPKIFNNKNLNVDINVFDEFLIEEGQLKIIAISPNIAIDQIVSKIQLTKIKKASNIDLTNIIGEMYVFEILKYIKTIQIGETSQDMSLLSIDDRLKLIEQLPASIVTKLNRSITEKFKNPEEEYLTVDGIKLTLDARLFV